MEVGGSDRGRVLHGHTCSMVAEYHRVLAEEDSHRRKVEEWSVGRAALDHKAWEEVVLEV